MAAPGKHVVRDAETPPPYPLRACQAETGPKRKDTSEGSSMDNQQRKGVRKR